LISSDIHNKEVSLSATEFNTLRVLFRVLDREGRPIEASGRPKSANSSKMSSGASKPLSSYAPFFNVPSQIGQQTSAKVHMSVIIEWINNLLLTTEPTEGIFKLNSLNKCVVTKS